MTKETIEKVLKYGLDLNQWFILSCIKNGEDISTLFGFKKVVGWKTFLQKKELLNEDGTISQKGILLLNSINDNTPILKLSPKDVIQAPVTTGSKAIFKEWVRQLHKKLQDELIRLTGRKQKYLKIGSSNYSFLDGPLDLETKLNTCITKYKLKDLNKIEKLLIRHCKYDNPLIKYYILKNDNSPLATDYDNFEDVIVDDKQNEERKPSSGAVDI